MKAESGLVKAVQFVNSKGNKCGSKWVKTDKFKRDLREFEHFEELSRELQVDGLSSNCAGLVHLTTPEPGCITVTLDFTAVKIRLGFEGEFYVTHSPRRIGIGWSFGGM